METLYFYYELTYDFGKPETGLIFDQTQFTNKYYPKNPYFKLPFRNLFTIYQVKSNCCSYICNSDKVKNDNGFLQKIDEFDNEKVKAFLLFHYNKYQGNKNDFLNYCQYLLNQDTWIIQDNFKKTILSNEIKVLQSKPGKSDTSKTGFQSSLTDEQITRLFELLRGRYIDINTNPSHFKAIFKIESLPPDCSIKWLKSKVLLSYFIKKFFHTDNPFNVWAKAENIFNVKDLQNSECNNPSPKGYKEIDILHKTINTHSQ